MKYVRWVEEYSNRPPVDVICYMRVDDVIMLQKAKSKINYKSDGDALKDFIAQRSGSIIESDE